jgi:hypothetical protein
MMGFRCCELGPEKTKNYRRFINPIHTRQISPIGGGFLEIDGMLIEYIMDG